MMFSYGFPSPMIAGNKLFWLIGNGRRSFKIHVLINRKYRKAMIADGLRYTCMRTRLNSVTANLPHLTTKNRRNLSHFSDSLGFTSDNWNSGNKSRCSLAEEKASPNLELVKTQKGFSTGVQDTQVFKTTFLGGASRKISRVKISRVKDHNAPAAIDCSLVLAELCCVEYVNENVYRDAQHLLSNQKPRSPARSCS